MARNARWGLVLLVLGILWNNYVYLHDLLLSKHEGWIYLGPKSYAGLAVAAVLIVAGLAVVWRHGQSAQAGEPPSPTPAGE